MNRRSFFRSALRSVAAGFRRRSRLPRRRAARGSAQDEDHAGCGLYSPPTLKHASSTRATWWWTVETDGGITGVGEGGARDTLGTVRRGASIGQDPQVHRAPLAGHVPLLLLPAGAARRKHALGALDLALWDIKGKVLKQPVHADPGRHGA